MRHFIVSRRCFFAGLLSCAQLFGAVCGYAGQKADSTTTTSPIASGPVRQSGRVTGFPLPRYVSIKSGRARMRVGPSTDYSIRWVYEAKGLPIEIIEEYGNWRQVRDSDGTTGWMSAVLLSGDRTGLVAPWRSARDKMISLRNSPSPKAGVVAELQPRVRLNIRNCDSHWCEVSVQGDSTSGYIRQELVWGVYRDEIISDHRL